MSTDLVDAPTPSQPIPVRTGTPRPAPPSRSPGRPLAALGLVALLTGAGVWHAVSPDARALAAGALSPGDPSPVAPAGTGDVTHLQPAVHRAVDRAIAAAAGDGVALRVTSGYRTAAHQQQLYDDAVDKYGTPAKARRWVLPPAESEHVKGGAVDVGPAAGTRWLDRHGVRYGLCRRYDNEPWHFELLAPRKGQSCPAREPHA